MNVAKLARGRKSLPLTALIPKRGGAHRQRIHVGTLKTGQDVFVRRIHTDAYGGRAGAKETDESPERPNVGLIIVFRTPLDPSGQYVFLKISFPMSLPLPTVIEQKIALLSACAPCVSRRETRRSVGGLRERHVGLGWMGHCEGGGERWRWTDTVYVYGGDEDSAGSRLETAEEQRGDGRDGCREPDLERSAGLAQVSAWNARFG